MPQPLLKHHWPMRLFPLRAKRELPHADSLAACASTSDGGITCTLRSSCSACSSLSSVVTRYLVKMLLNFFCSALFNLLPACHFSISSRSDKMRALASCTNGSKKLKKASFFSLTSEYSEKLGRGASTAVTAVLARLSGLESHPAKESNSAKINIFLINTSDQLSLITKFRVQFQDHTVIC